MNGCWQTSFCVICDCDVIEVSLWGLRVHASWKASLISHNVNLREGVSYLVDCPSFSLYISQPFFWKLLYSRYLEVGYSLSQVVRNLDASLLERLLTLSVLKLRVRPRPTYQPTHFLGIGKLWFGLDWLKIILRFFFSQLECYGSCHGMERLDVGRCSMVDVFECHLLEHSQT